jgi:hypothetical protein
VCLSNTKNISNIRHDASTKNLMNKVSIKEKRFQWLCVCVCV